MMILVLIGTMLWMVLKTTVVLIETIPRGDIKEVSKVLIVNVLMMLAILEVFRTTLTYFSDGRVKVTYIIDTVLVVVLTEVMVFWFKDIGYERLVMVIALVFTLVLARIVTIRFSPSNNDN
ncbi:MAG: phosphate-starvation-inducible PsiE family protein [Deltaproteobacteria bacterium]|nr:phosphate-starvation-inducible PsiE family protein [Deltaproteobacteria bacterium]